MNMEWLAVGGLAAAGGLIASTWQQIKSGFQRLSSYVLATEEFHEGATNAVLAYLRHVAKPSRFRPRLYYGWYEMVKTSQQNEVVLFETQGNRMQVFWIGWRPIWVSRGSNNVERDQTPQHERPVQLTSIRGLIDLEQFAILAVTHFNQQQHAARTSQFRRYGIAHYHGTLHDQPGLAGSDSRVNSSSSNPTGTLPAMAAARPVSHTREELGQAVPVGGSLKYLALPPEAEAMVTECQRWLTTGPWHRSRGLPWKRGYLLHGPPGSGKSACIRAIAEACDLPIFAADLATMSNKDLRMAWSAALSCAPAVFLLEDLDASFNGRTATQGEVTFDCLLNCIDGVAKADGVLIFITTNYAEKLDPALGGPNEDGTMAIRPGRIDRAIYLGPLSEAGRRQLVQRIIPEQSELWEETIEAGEDETGAQFERRCGDLARQWLDSSLQGSSDKLKAAGWFEHEAHCLGG